MRIQGIEFEPLIFEWLKIPKTIRSYFEEPKVFAENEGTGLHTVRGPHIETFYPARGRGLKDNDVIGISFFDDPLESPLNQAGVWFGFRKSYAEDGHWYFYEYRFQNLEKVERASFIGNLFDKNGFPQSAKLEDVEPGTSDWFKENGLG
jgi:hypothetical protein